MGYKKDEAERVAKKKSKEGRIAFEEFKRRHGIPASKKITDRKCQRLMKVGRDDTERPFFKPYFGLTYMSMVPAATRGRLTDTVRSLREYLDESGFGKCFLYVPEDTYHITFKGLDERILPDVDDPLEIEYYKTTYPLKASSDIPFVGDLSKFSCYTNLVLFAKVRPSGGRQVRLNIGSSTKLMKDFHLTIAYFITPVSADDRAKLKECLKEASESFLSPQVKFQVSDVQMFRFRSMAEYEPVPGTELP